MNIICRLSVTENHIRTGDPRSTMNDPIALALKEQYSLDIFSDELVAVGEDEIFMVRKGEDGKPHSYVADYPVKRFEQSLVPRTITLTFEEV